jgi:hypothetical protein
VSVAATNGWKFATPWSSFEFGFVHDSKLDNRVEVFLDEFALSGAMVPCP